MANDGSTLDQAKVAIEPSPHFIDRAKGIQERLNSLRGSINSLSDTLAPYSVSHPIGEQSKGKDEPEKSDLEKEFDEIDNSIEHLIDTAERIKSQFRG